MLNKESIKKIKLLLVDVDGVMTDGGIYYFDDGSRARRYHMHDGKFNALEKFGIKSGFCSQENDNSITLRADKLGISEHSIFGSRDKLASVKELLQKNNWGFEHLSYVGDDSADISLLRSAGVSFAVANAIDEVKKEADYITKKKGGEGAVREIIDIIIHEFDS